MVVCAFPPAFLMVSSSAAMASNVFSRFARPVSFSRRFSAAGSFPLRRRSFAYSCRARGTKFDRRIGSDRELFLLPIETIGETPKLGASRLYPELQAATVKKLEHLPLDRLRAPDCDVRQWHDGPGSSG